MELELDIDGEKVGPLFKARKSNHEGHRYPDNVNEWFSTAIGKQVIVLHSAPTKLQEMDPNRYIHMKEGDQRKMFYADAAFSLINKASVDDLRQRV